MRNSKEYHVRIFNILDVTFLESLHDSQSLQTENKLAASKWYDFGFRVCLCLTRIHRSQGIGEEVQEHGDLFSGTGEATLTERDTVEINLTSPINDFRHSALNL